MSTPTPSPETWPMTAAELKTLREALGFTLEALADLARVQLRTVKYWESGRFPVPQDVQDELRRLDALFDRLADAAVERARLDQPAGKVMTFLRYRTIEDLRQYRPDMGGLTPAAHGALLQRSVQQLRRAGYGARIVWMEPEQYEAWRRAKNWPAGDGPQHLWAAGEALPAQALGPRMPGRPAGLADAAAAD